MRIGILCYPTAGGSGVVASELGMALAGRGHEVHLFSYARPFRWRPHSRRFHWHEITIPKYPLFEYPSYGMAAACKIAEVPLDVLHAHYAYPHAVSACLAREMAERKFRTVVTLHGTEIVLAGQDPSFARATRFGLGRSDAVTAVSRFLREKALGWFDCGCRVEVVPDFVDVRRFTPVRSRAATVVHVTSFRPVKRTQDAIRAFSLIRRRVKAGLVVVGRGPDEDAARRLAGRLGVLRDVRFVGTEPEVARHLRGAGLLLSTSQFEGFGLAVLEAMACEVPVVTTDSGGVREVVSDECARVAPVGDVEALAEAAVGILRDRDLGRAMGKAGRRRAREVFGTDLVVPKYEAIYRRVCGAKNAENPSV